MRLLSLCALPVGAVYWIGSAPLPGGAAPGPKLTVVIKATYAVSFGMAELHPHARPMAGNEAVWFEDGAHPFVCSDFEPFKLRSDIVLVGHAHSHTPRQLIPLSFGVDTFRKSAVAVAGAPTHQIPLTPHHLRTGADPSGPVTSVGPTAPAGLRLLTEHPEAPGLVLEGRETHYPSLNCAPYDQQLATPISEAATIMLAGLSRDAPQKAFRLPSLRPQLFYLDPIPGPGEPADRKVPLVCDTLWMDVDSSTLTLTWRGIVPLSIGAKVPDLIMSLGLVGASKQHHDIWAQRERAREVALVTVHDIAPPTPRRGELPRASTQQLRAVSATEKMPGKETAMWEADHVDAPTPLHDETTDEGTPDDDDDQRATERPPALVEQDDEPTGSGLGKLPIGGRLGVGDEPRAPQDSLTQAMHLSSDPGQGLKLGFEDRKPAEAAPDERDVNDELDQLLAPLESDDGIDDESTGVIHVHALERSAAEESTGVINLDELDPGRQTLPFGPATGASMPEESTGVINLDEIRRKPATPFERGTPSRQPYDDLVEPTANLPGEGTPGIHEESTGLVDIAALRAGANLPFEEEEESTLNQPADSPMAQKVRAAGRVDSRDDDLSRTMGVSRLPDSALPFRHDTARPPAASSATPRFPREDGFLPFRAATPPAALPTGALDDKAERTVGETDWQSRNLLAPERFAAAQSMVWRGAISPSDFDAIGLHEVQWMVQEERWASAIDEDADKGERGLMIQLLDRLADVERKPSLESNAVKTAS